MKITKRFINKGNLTSFRMDDSILQDFFGREATLLLDGRRLGYYTSGGQSLEAIAEVSAEQSPESKFLRVDSIRYDMYDGTKTERRYGKGAIQKNYIIGIFEFPKQE